MINFNSDKYDNVVNLYKISKEKQEKIMKVVDDNRLTNPPGDYFQLIVGNEKIDIPKLEQVSVKTEDSTVESISTVEYIQRKLDSIKSRGNKQTDRNM